MTPTPFCSLDVGTAAASNEQMGMFGGYPSGGGSSMSTNPSERTSYRPSCISRIATSRVKIRKPARLRELRKLVLAEVVRRRLGAVDRVVDDGLDQRSASRAPR